jgi:hypothetical protein
VRPEEAGPQISLRHPRGSPPASSSISRIPLETISGVGRTSSRDAAVTPASLGNVARRFKTSAGSFFGANTTAPPQGAEEANADILRTSNFQGTPRRLAEAANHSFAFYSLIDI